MRRSARTRLLLASVALAALAAGAVSLAQTGATQQVTVLRSDGKPFSEAVKKGLAFLVSLQQPNGGWSQGEEAQTMRSSGEAGEAANVGDTCIAALALVRAGHAPKDNGRYSSHVARAADFVCAQVEKSSQNDLSVTDVKNTRLQSKLGPYVDTFLTSLLLAELKGKMADEKGEQLISAHLNKVISKIARNQKADGSWADAGWAPVLSQSIAAQGLNRAAQKGATVDDRVLARTEQNARDNFLPAGGARGGRGGFKLDGAASVPLYAAAANSAAGQAAVNTRQQKEAELRKVADDTKASKDEREKAEGKLKDIAADNKKANEAQTQANAAVMRQLADKQFVAGFGSNGGEEFLSYMQISETLRVKGGKEWENWDKSMAENLQRIQNPGGSWSGHHCITGRTFCTSAALLVLMADRAPWPIATEIQGKK